MVRGNAQLVATGPPFLQHERRGPTWHDRQPCSTPSAPAALCLTATVRRDAAWAAARRRTGSSRDHHAVRCQSSPANQETRSGGACSYFAPGGWVTIKAEGGGRGCRGWIHAGCCADRLYCDELTTCKASNRMHARRTHQVVRSRQDAAARRRDRSRRRPRPLGRWRGYELPMWAACDAHDEFISSADHQR